MKARTLCELASSCAVAYCMSALHLAQWKISEPLGMMMRREGPVAFGTNPPIPTGLSIKSPGDEASHDASDALLHELLKRGFDATRDPKDEPRPKSAVFVIMEHKPEGPQGEFKLQAEAEKKQKANSIQTSQP